MVKKLNHEEIQGRIENYLLREKDRRMQMWILSRLGGWRMVDIARRYGYRDGSGVLQVVKRLETTGDKTVIKKIEKLREMSRVKS